MTQIQLEQAWNQVRNHTNPYIDKKQEDLAFWYAKRNAPWTNRYGKSIVKGKAKGVGFRGKNFRIKSEVSLERVFPKYP